MIGFCVFFSLTLVAFSCLLCFIWFDSNGRATSDFTSHVVIWGITFICMLGVTIGAASDITRMSKSDTCIEKRLVTVDFADGPSRSESVWTCTMHKPETKDTK